MDTSNDSKIIEGSVRQNLGLQAAPFIHVRMSTAGIMLITATALLPVYAVSLYFYGLGILWQSLICTIAALVTEMTCALLRRRRLMFYVRDFSWLVTVLILSLTIPPLVPWQYTLLACLFALVVVKHCFGGMGMNIFNPAMAGFVFLLISAPAQIYSGWISPVAGAWSAADAETTAAVILNGGDPEAVHERIRHLKRETPDAFTGATYLESLKTARRIGGQAEAQTQMQPADFADVRFEAYVWSAGACTLGGLILMGFRIIIKRMVVAFLISFTAFAFIFWRLWPQIFMPPEAQLLLGGTLLATFFIITDPVTNAGTARGRIAFAVLTALLIILLRGLGAYSDSVAFAVMLGNCAAPLIDVLTRRRAFGSRFKRPQSQDEGSSAGKTGGAG